DGLSTPTASQVVNGEGAVAYGAVTWPAAISDQLPTSIPDGAYKVYVVIDNGTLSNVGESESFPLTAEEPGFLTAQQELSYVGDSGSHANTGSPVTVDLTHTDQDDWLLIGATQASGSGADAPFASLDIEGVVAEALPCAITDGVRKVAVFKVRCPAAAAGNATAEFTASLQDDNTAGRYNIFVYHTSTEPVINQWAAQRNTTMDVSLSGTVANAPVVLFAANASDQLDVSGLTVDGTAVTFVGRKHLAASDVNADGGDLTINVIAGTGNAVALSAEIGVYDAS
ncbi:hypothetical protein OAH97_02060, partial [Octadecabacter sp.]|nr:hypothetical protein [Octadecabacter sp.]